MARVPKRQRVAAYAVILRDAEILLSRLAPRISRSPLWTLPGGGLDHGEDPRAAVLREIVEETGLDAHIGDVARVYSMHNPKAGPAEPGRGGRSDYHALRIVYEGWVAPNAPEPRVIEVDGSTVEAAWHPLAEVLAGKVPVTSLVTEALADHVKHRLQRVAAYALVRRDDRVLLTRISALGHHSGSWTLPGGGVEHGESPAGALERELQEECGVRGVVGQLLTVHDVHFEGTAPSGRLEDFHGIHLVYAVDLPATAEPRVVEQEGTTDEVAWVPVADIETGRIPVLDVVRHALAAPVV
ncbi:NUDIX hydrolase [Nocardioides daejeonensis]|uniref:NUDIX hydrolase n=1 Tax=Nocardioides daejeonensis TaxID=1046556 RepID=UPI000D741820|nr:NUDIX domain-containing protein [Nocardioides daejeonensis]